MEKTNQEIAREVAKVLMMRRAKRFNNELPIKFWNIIPYKSEYQRELIRVHSLIKTYEPMAVYNTFTKDKIGKTIYTLKFPGLADLIAENELKIKKEKAKNNIAKTKIELDKAASTTIRQPRKNKKSSLKDKLNGGS